MLRTALILAAAALAFAPSSAAQKKQKDPVLQQYLVEEFGKVSRALAQLNDRLTALEGELERVKQQQGEQAGEVRKALNLLGTTDAALSSFRLSAQQDLLSLKTDLNAIRQELLGLGDLMKKAAAPPAAAPEAPRIEGYITSADEKEVTINLGSGAGVKVGTRFSVYRAGDPQTQIGVVEVVAVLDANNSRAKIIFSKPDARFEFSDIVRLMM
jgi:hypothetical protein